MIEEKTCRCGRTFIVTEGDREYYAVRGWHVPNACHACRFDRRPLKGGMYHQLGGEFGAQRQPAH